MTSTMAGPSQATLSIVGLPIGALDPTQPARLLSSPDSRLSFATFHPLAASHSLQKEPSRSDELCSNRRVVVETLPTGESFWRWVPRAKGVENGGDEGEWPRVVNICGRLVMCSQDQWDIYKLDPQYECTVYPVPALSTITRRISTTAPATFRQTPPKAKRAHVEESSDEELPMPGNLKKTRHVPGDQQPEAEEDDFTDSDEEVEMIVESAADLATAREARRRKTEENRKKRRARLASAMEKKAKHSEETPVSRGLDEVQDLSMLDLTLADTQPTTETQAPPDSNPPPYAPQSQSGSVPAGVNGGNPSDSKRAHDSSDVPPAKRARTRSPSGVREELAKKKSNRERFKQGKYYERLKKMRADRDHAFVEGLRATVPPEWQDAASSSSSTSSEPSPPTPQDTEVPEDPISLEEKVRRIQEINAYEQARRERDEAQKRAEAAEAERKRKQEEALRREHEKAERLRREREQEEERRRKQQEEDARRRKRQQEEAERARREQERRQEQERHSYGPWTTQRALERYKNLADAFDAAQYSQENPISFSLVPWPVLHKPSQFSIEDVDWASVEAFFAAVRTRMRAAEYKAFVEKSHRRFHPDRWRARRVLQSVKDDELRACLEVAANTVAQAITPLWREVKSI